MQPKISVLLVKGKNIGDTSDMNKMAVHIEQVLTEKDGIDFKTRQGLTDPAIKSSSFIIFCGYDLSTLTEISKTLGVIEGIEGTPSPLVIVYEEPGVGIDESLNRILMEIMDLGRLNPKVFNKLVHTSSYRDIIGYIDASIRKLGTPATV